MSAISEPDIANWRRRMPRAFGLSWSARLRIALPLLLLAALVGFAMWRLKFSLAKILAGVGQLGKILMLMVPPSTSPQWLMQTAKALAETVAMAFLGTFIAFVIASLLAFLAARNTMPSLLVRQLMRRLFDTLRGVEQIIWALIFVAVVGLGPCAGILAIVVAEIGILAKLFSEAIEAADPRPVEGVRAAGGSALQRMRFALFPQVLPNFLSLALYQFESNTRSATILGMVGAGGVGLLFAEMTRTYEWPRVGTLLIAVWLAVAAIDWAAGTLRRALVTGRREG